ncbi:MAG: NPCBM/NEW2 domain-containing protein [Phycisphaerae bacterium]
MRQALMSPKGWFVRVVLALGVFATCVAPPAWAAEAAESGAEEATEADARARQAAEAFERLYGKDVERVRGTREAADDVALAKRLLGAAREATGTPALLAVLCENAYDLAAGSADGYATAVEAAEFLASQVPEEAVACAERVAEVRRKQYASAEGEAKTAAGEAYIGALLAQADAHLAADEYPQAVAAARKALGIARTIESDRVAVIDARRKRAEFLLRTRRDIENMKALIARDPENAAAREKLVRLYLVHLDDPAAAAEHLEGVEDEDLLKYVPAVGKGVEAAPELACVELGDWYRSLGETAPTPAKRAMFERAKAYYDRFLSLHETEDLERTTATLALKKVEDLLADLGPATTAAATTDTTQPTETAAVPKNGIIKPGEWLDLLPLLDPARHGLKGTWEARDGGVALVKAAGGARLMLPAAPIGEYDLEVTFARTWGDHAIVATLPIGTTGVAVVLNDDHGVCDGLDALDGKAPRQNETRTAPVRLRDRRDCTVHATVRRASGGVGIDVTVDGKPHLAWQGPASRLSVGKRWKLPDERFLGLGAHFTRVEWKRVRLKMHSGQARLLRPPGGPSVRPDVYLDTLTPVRAVSGNHDGRTHVNRNCSGAPLRLNGVTYERGIGEHAKADLTYALKPEYRRFVCTVGLDDQVGRHGDVRGSVIVMVLADKRPAFRTPLLQGAGASCNMDIAIPRGAKTLRLVVDDAGDGVGYDDVDFVNAGFMVGEATGRR